MSTEEELSGFIRNTAAYDIGRAATALAKSGGKKCGTQFKDKSFMFRMLTETEVKFVNNNNKFSFSGYLLQQVDVQIERTNYESTNLFNK